MEKPWLKEYDSGVPATIDYPHVPIPQFLIDTATKYPNKSAMVFGGVVEPLGNALMDTSMSYKRLLDLTYRFAAILQKLGVKKGDRVAVHLPNCPQFVIAYYATLMVGGIVVPCNPQYVARELKHQLSDSGAKIAVTLSLTYPIVKQVRGETQLEHVIVTNIKEYFPGLAQVLVQSSLSKRRKAITRNLSGDANTYWFQDLLSQGPAQPTAGGGSAGRDRRLDVHRRHDRYFQGRAVDAPQSGGQCNPDSVVDVRFPRGQRSHDDSPPPLP